MRFFTVTLIMLTCFSTLAGIASAQEEFVLEGEQATLQMDVPSGWQSQISPGALGLYGIMSRTGTDEIRTDVQVVFRHINDLLGVVNEPIAPNADNPAEDYLFKYATRYSGLLEGTYDLPQSFVMADDIPGAAMLYVERTESSRLGQGVELALSLSVVFWLGDDEVVIVLFDTPASDGEAVLPDWIEILQTFRLNDEPLPFADDIEGFLSQFEAAEDLLNRYQTSQQVVSPPPLVGSDASSVPLPGENLSITHFGQILLFSRYDDWSIDENDEPESMTLVADDDSATIRLEILTVSQESQSAAAEIEAYIENYEAFTLLGDPVPFGWNPMDAAAANLIVPSDDDAEDKDNGDGDGDGEREPERVGQIIIGRYLPGNVIVVLLLDAEPDISAQLVQDWQNTLTAIRFNNQNLPFEQVLLALAQLPTE